MSAYMVSKAHIDALIHVGLYGPAQTPDASFHWESTRFGLYPAQERVSPATVNKLGAMLAAENLSSIQYRYPDCIAKPENTPGSGDDFWARPFQFQQFLAARIPTVTAFSLIACYEYQSCEHPGWDESAAHQYCRDLQKSLIRTLPGYDKAPWGIDAWSDIKPAKPLLADAPVREVARALADTILTNRRKAQDATLLQMPVRQTKLF